MRRFVAVRWLRNTVFGVALSSGTMRARPRAHGLIDGRTYVFFFFARRYAGRPRCNNLKTFDCFLSFFSFFFFCSCGYRFSLTDFSEVVSRGTSAPFKNHCLGRPYAGYSPHARLPCFYLVFLFVLPLPPPPSPTPASTHPVIIG